MDGTSFFFFFFRDLHDMPAYVVTYDKKLEPYNGPQVPSSCLDFAFTNGGKLYF